MMTHVNNSVRTEVAVPKRPPGYLLTPLGWAAEPLTDMVHTNPSLLPDLFAISRPRMHLIALVLAHLEPPMPSEIGPLLLRSARHVLGQLLGHAPAGIKRVLRHLPPEVLEQENYRRLVELLIDTKAAKVLHHANRIDDTAIRVLAELPPPLRRLAIVVPDWPRKLDGLTASLQFLVSRGIAPSVEELVAALAVITTRCKLAALIGSWLDALPLPEGMPPIRFAQAQRLDDGSKIASLARRWRNCLADYTGAIDIGACAVYLWDDQDRPAACLARRHGRLGWFLDEIKGPRNTAIETSQLAAITTAFGNVGVPSSHTVRAIERITYGHGCGLLTTNDD